MIKIKNLSKKYNDFYALKDVNLDLPNKGLIGISGESGSGKSTLLNAISLMDNNYKGQIIINKKNILKFNNKQKDKYHLNIGYVFQNPYLFDFCSVKENIEYISLIKGKKENINNILKKVGLEKYKNKSVNCLSGGQRQRVSIAASLISKPMILLCDEPTGALDSVNSKKIMDILKEVSKEILVIIVSHDLHLLKEYADDIIYLENGEIKNIIKENKKEKEKIKFNKRNIFSYFKFIFKFAFKNILIHKNRTLITSIMVSFGLIGIIFSILIKDGFSSFFSETLGSYESNKYTYVYSVSDSEEIEVLIDTFEEDFVDYNTGYFYKYEFMKNEGINQNIILINDKDIFLNFNNLCYLKEVEGDYLNNEIGLECSKQYIEYLYYVFSLNSLYQLNYYLKHNEVYLEFIYLDNMMNLNFKLRLKEIRESNNEYTNFIHSDSYFLYDYFSKYISLNLSDDQKIILLPYIEEGINYKNELLTSEEKKKYDYVFENEIYDKNYTLVIKSLYYRFDINKVNEIANLINSNYYFVSEKGIDILGNFNNNISFIGKDIEIRGNKLSFVPDDSEYGFITNIKVSKGLYELLKSNVIGVKGYNNYFQLNIIDIIEEDDLIIYQNSYWSYLLLKELFCFEEYDCLANTIALSNSNDESITNLKENYSEFEIVCPLKEVNKEIDKMIDKVQLVLVVLSSFCIAISLLLMAVIVFINTLEQSKLIAILRINGIRKIDVVLIFILEAILLGMVAFIISLWFSVAFSIELNFAFNMLIESKETIEFITLKKDTLLNVFYSVILMSFISGIIPSFLAANADSLKILKN